MTFSLSFEMLWHLLLALAAVIVLGQALGRAMRLVGQPPVIGEILAGILIGPSLLGRLAPDTFLFLLPSDVVPLLSTVAQVGVVLYMFVVGLDLDLERMRGQLRTTAIAAVFSMVLPFVLGAGLAVYLFSSLAPEGTPLLHFTLFVGVAMSVTAFPVLARILSDFKMRTTELGVLALACAAMGDVAAWCLLAFVVGIVNASGGSALVVVVLTAGFVALMFGVVRPMFERVPAPGRGAVTLTQVASVLLLLLAASLATEEIGIHPVFGAFIAGLVVPSGSNLAGTLKRLIERPVAVCLLPAFFAFTGLRTEIGLVSGLADWLVCGVIVAVATAGKFTGAALGARAGGLNWRLAIGLGVLMNTRGLMELIVLNVGLDLGVITPTLFTMLVLMALVTTVTTAPALRSLKL